MSIDINKELKKYEEYLTLVKLEKSIKRPVSVCPEEITAMLPSIAMGTDGPVLVSMFLVTPHYLCEVNLGSANESFDYIRLDTIANYRVVFSDKVVKKADESEIHYQVANIVLLHNIGFEFNSSLNYVGTDRKQWFKMVSEAIPLSVMK